MQRTARAVALYGGLAGACILLTWGVLQEPMVAAVCLAIAAFAWVLARVHSWWTRAYVLTIVAMFAGASGIPQVAAVGAYAKIAAVGFLLLVTLATAAGQRARFANGKHKAIIGALWFLAAAAVASFLWSRYPVDTLLEGGTTVALILILHRVSTTRWQDREALTRDITTAYWTVTALIGSGLATAAIGIVGTVIRNGRHQGLLSNPNLLGAIAAVALALGVGVALRKPKLLVWLSLAIPGLAVVLSQSRTALLAATIGIVWALLRGRFSRIIPIGITVIVGVILYQTTGLGPLGDAIRRFTSNDGGDVLNTRTNVWSEVWWNVLANPTGVGWAATPSAMESYYLSGRTASGLFTTHNSWIQVFNDLGWVGIVPILGLMVTLTWVAVSSDATKLGAGLVGAAMTGSLVHFTESVAFGVGQPYPWVFWVIAVAAAVNSGPRKARSSQSSRAKRVRGSAYAPAHAP